MTVPTLPLLSGSRIPQVGLGVFQTPPGTRTHDAVLGALRAGYRHIDTARIYNNEADVGIAVRESGIPRDQIFVTTKLWNDDQGYDSALRAFDASLERLGFDYVDLYLIHWPLPERRLESWRALETLFADQRARAIGVSNYLVNHLDELLATSKIVPAVNQIELSPFLQRRDTTALCKQRGIVVESYSPLTRGERLDHPVVRAIATQTGRSSAQVLVRWGIQHGFVVLPKSIRLERIIENHCVFDFTLDAAQLEQLDGLEENLTTGWDPAEVD